MAVVLVGENCSPCAFPHWEILSSAVCAKRVSVCGSGPEIRIVPSSANPMMSMFELFSLTK